MNTNNTTTNQSNTKVTVGPNTTPTANPLVQTVQTIQQGQVPHNSNLQSTIQQTQVALDEAKYEAPLSQKGQVLVEDFKQVLDSANRMIQEKNGDEKFQRFLGTGIGAAKDTRAGMSGSNMPVGRDDLRGMKGPAREMYTNGKSIVMFAVRSGRFREIIQDILGLFQSFIGSAQQKVGNANNASEFGNQMYNDTLVPDQQKQAVFDKLKILLTELSSQPQYYTAVDHLFTILDQIGEKAKLMSQSNVQAQLPTDQYSQAWGEAKIFLEEFAGQGYVEDLEFKLRVIFDLLRNDQEATNCLYQLRVWMLETIKNPAILNDQSQVNYGKSLLDKTRWIFSVKYQTQFNDVLESLKIVLNNIRNDASTQDFSAKLRKFGADFAFDEQGRPDLFVIQESLGQMKSILVPVLTKELANLPIPRIEGSNPKYDFSIEGMVLHLGDLLPEFINFRTKTDTNVSVQRLSTQKNSTKIIMEVQKIRAVFRDIRFFYRRKRMPKIEDHGIADVDLSQGTGISVKIVWKLKSRLNQPYLLRLLKVKCSIDRLAITVRNAKHNVIDKLATKLFAGTIKKQMANAIVNNIIKGLQPLSVKLNELFKRSPTTGIMNKANDGMKAALFNEDSLVTQAKQQLQNVKETIQEKKAQADMQQQQQQNIPITNIGQQQSIPVTNVGQGTYMVEPLGDATAYTFVEKEGRTNKPWNFQWYNASSADVVEGVSEINMGDKTTTTTNSAQPFVSI